ncbi:hypothetical protein EMCRGX_G024824 [Ephydatia muelleri]|eukprot:Em0015g981a
MSEVVPRGIPKSGRFWRTPGTRSNSKIALKSLKTPWSKRQKEREEKKILKLYQQQLKEAKQKEKEEKKRRIEEHKARREENKKKAEIVQKITNSKKLKRLSKKQFKMIEKR